MGALSTSATLLRIPVFRYYLIDRSLPKTGSHQERKMTARAISVAQSGGPFSCKMSRFVKW